MSKSRRDRKTNADEPALAADKSGAGKPAANKSADGHGGQRRVITVGAIATLAVVAALTAVYLRPLPPPVVPPQPDLSGTPRPVAEIIAETHDALLRDLDSAEAWGKLGMAYFAHQFEAEAAICFARAEQLDQHEYRWPYLYALTIGVSDTQKAENGYRRALKLRDNQSVIYTRLAELLLAAERFDEAEPLLEQALRYDGKSVRALLALSRRRLVADDLSGALELAREAAQLAPETREVHELLAQLLRRSGDSDGARDELALAGRHRQAEMLWNDPIGAEVLEFRRDARWSLDQAEQLANEGRYGQASETLRQAILADDRDPELYSTLGRYLIQAKRFGDAEQILDHGLKRHPNAVEVRFQRGTVDFLLNRFAKAETWFREVLAARPEYYLAHYNLGHTLAKLDRADEAIKSFEEAARLRPDFADAHTNAGRLLLAAGQKPAAVDRLKTAVRLAPNDNTARQLLEKAMQK